MSPLDFAWHLLNLFWVPAAAGALTALLARLLWRRALGTQRLALLVRDAALAACAAAVLALVLLGRDGRMAGYAAMALASAGVLWWRARGRG